MSAKKKAVVGIVIGIIVCIGLEIVMITQFSETGRPMEFGTIAITSVAMIFGGALFGFGYAFGMGIGIRWLRNIFGVAAGVSVISVIFSRNKSQSTLVALFTMVLIIACCLGVAYIPGIVIGIRDIIRENKIAKNY